jgi:sterol desaturase/sphingolipid hydroxylase (fatty acid hydroxylase superfamily)
MKFIEWFYVTPRVHSIHHAETGSVTKNLGALLTVFDRIFGTYVDPDTVTLEQIQFASGDNALVTPRKIIGV